MKPKTILSCFKTLLVAMLIFFRCMAHSQFAGEIAAHYKPVKLNILTGYENVHVKAMSNGTIVYIVGICTRQPHDTIPVMWTYHGTETELIPVQLATVPFLFNVIPTDVNDAGAISGYGKYIFPNGSARKHAVYWEAGSYGRSIDDLTNHHPPSKISYGNTISNSGKMLGDCRELSGAYNRGFLYNNSDHTAAVFKPNLFQAATNHIYACDERSTLIAAGEYKLNSSSSATQAFVIIGNKKITLPPLPSQNAGSVKVVRFGVNGQAIFTAGYSTVQNSGLNIATVWKCDPAGTTTQAIDLTGGLQQNNSMALDINTHKMAVGTINSDGQQAFAWTEHDKLQLLNNRLVPQFPNMGTSAQPHQEILTDAVAVNDQGLIACNAGLLTKPDGRTSITNGYSAYLLLGMKPLEVSLFKIVSVGEVNPGECITYTFTIFNTNNVPLSVSISDPLPEGTTFETCGQTQNAAWHLDGTNVVTDPLSVAAGNFTTINLTVKVNENRRTDVVNNHYRTIITGEAQQVWNNPVTTRVRIPETDVSISKSAPPTIAPGECLTYTFIVSNTNSADVQIAITDPVPPGTAFDNACPHNGWSYDGTNLIYNGTIPAQTTVPLTTQLKVTATSGFIVNHGYKSKTNTRPEQTGYPDIVTEVGFIDPNSDWDDPSGPGCRAFTTCDDIPLSITVSGSGMTVSSVVFKANYQTIAEVTAPIAGRYQYTWHHPYPGYYHIEAEVNYFFPGQPMKTISAPGRTFRVKNSPDAPYLPMYRLLFTIDSLEFTRDTFPEDLGGLSVEINDNHQILLNGNYRGKRASIIWDISTNTRTQISFLMQSPDVYDASLINNNNTVAGSYRHLPPPEKHVDMFRKVLSGNIEQLNNLLPYPPYYPDSSNYPETYRYLPKKLNASGSVLFGSFKTKVIPGDFHTIYSQHGKLWKQGGGVDIIDVPAAAGTINYTIPVTMNDAGVIAGVFVNSAQPFKYPSPEKFPNRLFIYNHPENTYINTPVLLPPTRITDDLYLFNNNKRDRSLMNIFVNNKNHIFCNYAMHPNDVFSFSFSPLSPSPVWNNTLVTEQEMLDTIAINNYVFDGLEGLNDFDFLIGQFGVEGYGRGDGPSVHFITIPQCQGLQFINERDILAYGIALWRIEFSDCNFTGINNYGEISGFYKSRRSGLDYTYRPFALIPIGPNTIADSCPVH